MSYTFPHFDDIPNPELINFTAYPNAIIDNRYCELTKECKGCVFDASEKDCAATFNAYLSNRKELLNYVTLHHPEYLI